MILIAILIGVVLGQHIKISPSTELVDFCRSSWALLTEQMPGIKAFTASTVEAIVMPKLQKTVETEFQKVDKRKQAT